MYFLYFNSLQFLPCKFTVQSQWTKKYSKSFFLVTYHKHITLMHAFGLNIFANRTFIISQIFETFKMYNYMRADVNSLHFRNISI